MFTMVNQKTFINLNIIIIIIIMKKFVFTTLAVVAFSGVAMANNRVEMKIGILNKDNVVLFFTSCENWAMDQMDLYGEDQSPSEAHDDYRSLVELCDSN